MCHNDSLTQFTWSRPQSNTMLFEGGGSVSLNAFGTANFGTSLDGSDYEECGQSQPFRVNIADAARGANYHGVGAIGIGISNLFVGRFAMSYVTGAHNLKSGLHDHSRQRHGQHDQPGRRRRWPADLLYLHERHPDRDDGVRDRNTDAHMDKDLALYAQDPWTMQRLTLNLGLRMDWISQSGRRSRASGELAVPGRTRAAPWRAPNWKDLSPRIGAAYDLFGNGKTALKGGINRYVAGGSTGVAAQFGPTANSSTTRNWTDSNGNFFPDCDLKNRRAQNLRTRAETCAVPTTTRAWHLHREHHGREDFTNGWFKRGYNWRASAGIEQQLTNRLAVSATYARTIYGNFSVTDNLNLTPADYDPVLHHAAHGPPAAAQRTAAVRALGSARQRRDQQSRWRSPITTSTSIRWAAWSRVTTEHFNGFDSFDGCTVPEPGRSTPDGASATRFRTPPSRPTAAS